MSPNTTENGKPDPKPPKKAKWYWTLFWFVAILWMLGGVKILLLQDIPLLLFLGIALGLFFLPVARWLGRPQRSWITAVWGLGVIIAIWVSSAFVIPPFSISRQTTYLTEPRAKTFYGIDYHAVIDKQLDPGGPAEDNGFRLLIETFGRSLFDFQLKDQHWDRLCRYLDLPTDTEPKLTFVDWRSFARALPPEESQILNKSSCRETTLPWSEEAKPIVRRWLDGNDAALDQFAVAARKPVLYLPLLFGNTFLDSVFINDHCCREMVRSLEVRVGYRLAVGEIDAAWDDVLAMYRIAGHHRRAVWNMSSSLIDNSIMSETDRAAEAVMIRSGWSAEEIRRKLDEIAPFQQPFRDDEIKGFLLNERFTALDSAQHLMDEDALSRDRSDFDRFKQRIGLRFCRLGIIMTRLNRRFDEMERQFFNDTSELNDKREIPDMYEILKTLAWYGQIGAPSALIARTMEGMLFATYEPWRISLKKRQTEAVLTYLAFALEAYRREHGHYPERLVDLPEHEIDEVSVDPFSKAPFRYLLKPSADGEPGFLLYSVGPNGIDEDGRGWADDPRGDDIRRRMPLPPPPVIEEPESPEDADGPAEKISPVISWPDLV